MHGGQALEGTGHRRAQRPQQHAAAGCGGLKYGRMRRQGGRVAQRMRPQRLLLAPTSPAWRSPHHCTSGPTHAPKLRHLPEALRPRCSGGQLRLKKSKRLVGGGAAARIGRRQAAEAHCRGSVGWRMAGV